MVANCPRCRMQAVPEMCQYLAGTEPPGLRFDDVMSSSPASIRTATARPGQVSHADRADGGALAQPQKRQNSLGLSRQRHQGTTEKAAGAWAAGGQERQMRLPGATASFTVRTTANNKRIANVGEVKKALMDSGVSKDRSRGYLSAIMQKLRQAAHSGGKTEGNHTSVVAEPTAVSRRLLRVAVKRGPQARQPIFSPPGPRVASLTRQVLSEWRQNPERCGIWTKDCVRRYMAGDDLGLRTSFRNETELGRRHPLKKVFVNNEIPNVKSVPDLFPDLKPGSLGSCAVVAVGDNMLHQGRGWQIDAHDTVWRYNSPMNNFKRDIGKKSDVIYWKMRKDEKDYGQEDQTAGSYYMWKEPVKFWEFGKKSDWQSRTFRGKPLLWPNGVAMRFGQIYREYKEENRVTTGTPAGGFKFALDVLASGLCKRIDLYGFTARGSAKYFKRESYMKPRHISGLEHWVYREAQSQGLVCIYD